MLWAALQTVYLGKCLFCLNVATAWDWLRCAALFPIAFFILFEKKSGFVGLLVTIECIFILQGLNECWRCTKCLERRLFYL